MLMFTLSSNSSGFLGLPVGLPFGSIPPLPSPSTDVGFLGSGPPGPAGLPPPEDTSSPP